MSARPISYYYNNFTNGDDASKAYVSDGGAQGDSTFNTLKNAPKSSFTLNNRSNTNNSNTQTGSITNPYDIIKNGSGNSKISQISDQFKTGIETEADLADASKIQDAILKQLKLESDLHTQINESMSMSGEYSRAFRESIVSTLPKAAMLGYDISNISEAITNLADKSAKLNIIASNTLEQGFDTARAFGMTLPQLTDAFGEFEKVGYGAADTIDKINIAGLKSVSLGLNARKTTQELKDNIGKLNEYGFANGVQGLNRMVQKAAEFRMSMAETFKVAEKVMNPEDAIALTANIQMLGGAVGDLNDPLKLMYLATNNVEGLQDALQGAASTLATYNKEQGRFEIVGANLRRAKEMATQLGVSYQEFAKGAIAANERIAAGETLASKGFDINDKDKEFLTNLSSMKDGELQIVIPKSLSDSLGKELGVGKDNEIKLSELSSQQVNILKGYQKELENKTPAELAQDMFSETAKIQNNTESTARALTIYGKRQLFGREGRMLEEGNLPVILPLVKGIGELRKEQSRFIKDENYIKSVIDTPLNVLKSGTTILNTSLNNLITSVSGAAEALRMSTNTKKTNDEIEIEKENKRRQEGAKAGNASINHYHTFKISKSNELENYSIDRTSAGYTTELPNSWDSVYGV